MYKAMDTATKLMQFLCDLLASHSDFSLLHTLRHLENTTEVNPNFEATLKRNAEGDYCRSHISENATYLYLPEMEIIFDEVKKAFEGDFEIDRSSIKSRIKANTEQFFATPLSEMVCIAETDMSTLLKNAAEIIEEIDFSYRSVC